MRVALLTSTGWLDEEVVGFRESVDRLAGEGVDVVQILPERYPREDMSPVGSRLTWDEPGWAWLRPARMGRLAGAVRSLDVDVLHAMDGSLWRGASRLAARLNMPVVLSAASAEDLAEADALPRGADARAAFIVTTEPLAAALRKRVGAAATIELIRPGVKTTSGPLAARSQASLCVAIAGAEALDADFEALLEAIKRVVRDAPECQFFLAGHSDTHRLWQAARRADLLANLSLVPRRLGQGELLLRADVLIHPQATGRSRWLSLQAMARGQTLLARADSWLDYLIDDQTAWVVPEPTAEPWERLLRRALEEPGRAAALGERARLWVGQRYSYSRQVAQTLGLYRHLVGASLPFSAAGQR